ncbi:hypothetical protein ACLMJK_002013 [Lecanora helva]
MSSASGVKYGRKMRDEHFTFDPAYTPLNHGSYGAFPHAVRQYQRQLQDHVEARSDPYIRFTIPELLVESRRAAAELLGASVDDLVFVPNATTAVNVVLRNLKYANGDVILYFSTAYGACEKTIQYVCETTLAESKRIDVTFPIDDDVFIQLFRQSISQLRAEGRNARIAMFDTVVTFPGVRLPWEALVRVCKDMEVLSLIDGAHGIGHIDLTHLASVGPDFFTSNCYNMTQDKGRFADQFKWLATVDQTPYLCVPKAIQFRREVCGGEEAIREHCFSLARAGGRAVASILGTEVMENSQQTLGQCCFTNVRLPFDFAHGGLEASDGPGVVKCLMDHAMTDFDTWTPARFYGGAVWVRLSAQIYLEMKDFTWAGEVLLKLCHRIMKGEWRSEQQ